MNFQAALLILLSLLLYACGSSKFGELGAPEEMKREQYGLDDSLADVLKRKGNVQVSGIGNDATITIRGQNSISLDTRPLYILNGVVIGHSYSKANSLVVPSEIHSIRILRGLSETAVYGEDGRNGVIVIKTRSNENEKATKLGAN